MNESSPHRENLSAVELEVLRALCGRRGEQEKNAELLHTLETYRFLEPEHQVVFESIRAVAKRADFSASVMAVHLNNRGFPDLEMGKYFVDRPPSLADGLASARALASRTI